MKRNNVTILYSALGASALRPLLGFGDPVSILSQWLLVTVCHAGS